VASRDKADRVGKAKRSRGARSGAAPTAAARFEAMAIFAAVNEVPYEWRIDTDALTLGPNAASVLASLPAEGLSSGKSYSELVVPQSGSTRAEAILRAAPGDAGTPYTIEYALKGAGSAVIWIEDSGRVFAGPDGKPHLARGVLRVINERRERDERLTYLSRFDALTGELNRTSLTELLEETIAETVKLRSSCGFLLAAIDELGRINEAYGLDIADEVVAAVAKRLHSQMRGKDHLGRVSGNKFGIILNNCTGDDLAIAADRLVAGIRNEVMQTSAGPVAATVTIGGITAPRHARNVGEVLTRAHEALYQARARRRGSYLTYQPNPQRAAERAENVRATDEILSALNERRIYILFEPVVDVRSRAPAFYECLMRIRRADGSLLAVNEFIPWAERLGLVRLLDHRVLDLVTAEMIAAPKLNASVNVSAASTSDPDWWASLEATLRAHPGVAERLTVEITETAAIENVEDTRAFVTRVKDLGCRIAIDDFGAGYTSFRTLRQLGVDLVKIDGAFVRNLMHSEDDRAFVHTLVDLGKRLGLKTVAEWVQDEGSAEILAEWGCDYLQGALVGLASAERPWEADIGKPNATKTGSPRRA
jgi:diguanylate cyclase (GGDEF)-like protein